MTTTKVFKLYRVFEDRPPLEIAAYEVEHDAEAMRSHIKQEFPTHNLEVVSGAVQI